MNWGQLKTAASQYLEAGSTKYIANLGLFARLAEEDIYRSVQMPFSRETALTTMVPGDRFLTQPDNCMSVYSMSVYTNAEGKHSFLLPKEAAYIREAYPDPLFLGLPRYYAYHDEITFLIGPTPDTDYNVEMAYFMKPTSISLNDVSTNSNWLSVNGENALLFGMVLHGYIFEKGDQDVIQAYKAQFDKAIGDLKLITEGRQRKDTYRAPDQRLPT